MSLPQGGYIMAKEIKKHPWIQRFYPYSVREIDKTMPELDAAKLSLLKWSGLENSMLESYNVEIRYPWYSVFDKETSQDIIAISGNTCALCEIHSDEHDDTFCNDCVITKVFGHSCNHQEENDEPKVPWKSFIQNKDVMPMIKLLTQCVSELETRGKWWVNEWNNSDLEE